MLGHSTQPGSGLTCLDCCFVSFMRFLISTVRSISRDGSVNSGLETSISPPASQEFSLYLAKHSSIHLTSYVLMAFKIRVCMQGPWLDAALCKQRRRLYGRELINRLRRLELEVRIQQIREWI